MSKPEATMRKRTLIVYGSGERVVLRDDQIDCFFDRGRGRENPDALTIAKEITNE